MGKGLKKLTVLYFLEKEESALADLNIDSQIRSRLNGLVSQLDEEDNPVLLIGKIK